MTVFTRTWDASYKAIPATADDALEGALRIRNLKTDISERLVVDHSYTGDANDGMHKQITLADPLAAKPTQANDETYLYSKDVGGTAELFYEDEAENEVQLTGAGSAKGDMEAGTVVPFYQAAAPTGWTESGSLDDHALRIVTVASTDGGSAQANTSGVSDVWGSGKVTGAGGVHSHTVAGNTAGGSAGVATANGSGHNSNLQTHLHSFSVTSGNSSSHTHTLAGFDLKYASFIVCSKD